MILAIPGGGDPGRGLPQAMIAIAITYVPNYGAYHARLGADRNLQGTMYGLGGWPEQESSA